MSVLARCILACVLLSSTALADDHFVPPQLEEWRQWVLKDKEYRDCPFYFDRGAIDRALAFAADLQDLLDLCRARAIFLLATQQLANQGRGPRRFGLRVERRRLVL